MSVWPSNRQSEIIQEQSGPNTKRQAHTSSIRQAHTRQAHTSSIRYFAC